MRVYIAGPMAGYPYFNFPLFNTTAKSLRLVGYDVVNPAEHDIAKYPDLPTWPGYSNGDTSVCPKFDLAACLKWDFQNVMDCDAIVMLPGWERSSGACDERRVAERTGVRVFLAVFDKDEHDPMLIEDHQRRMLKPEVQEFDCMTARGGY